MRKRDLPLLRHHIEEALHEPHKETIQAKYVMVPTTTAVCNPGQLEVAVGKVVHDPSAVMPDHHAIRNMSPTQVNLFLIGLNEEWRDEIRLVLDFDHPDAWRQILSIIAYDGDLPDPEENRAIVDGTKPDQWNLLYKFGNDDLHWAKVEEVLTRTPGTKTIVICHTRLELKPQEGGDADEDDEEDYPFESHKCH